jgi:hypothetical protein
MDLVNHLEDKLLFAVPKSMCPYDNICEVLFALLSSV